MKKSNNSKRALWVSLAVIIVLAIAAWCVYNVIPAGDEAGIFGSAHIFNFNSTFVLFTLMFVIVAFGYLLGGIEIKGVSLGTAGVFLMAILVGWLCTLDFSDVPLLGNFHIAGESDSIVKTFKSTVQNTGLILFVGAVGFIAGPNFFKDLAKNFKTYITLGVIIILSGTAVAVICTLLTPEYGPEYWSGVLSGALTSTPGFSAAKDAVAASPDANALEALITLGHAIAYPFGVIGVVLFVQLIPRFLKVDMDKERELLKSDGNEERKMPEKLFKCEELGLMPFALAVICGLALGSITIPLSGAGYDGPCFSLGTTGGVLIMCLIFGHFGHFGKLSLEVPHATLKVLREFGLAMFLLVAGFHGGVALVEQVSKFGGDIVAWGFIGGALMTIVPMAVGLLLAKYLMKLPLLNSLGSITGGMTSTPALGALIKSAKTDDVAGAYASTYPIALVLIVLACQLMITLMG